MPQSLSCVYLHAVFSTKNRLPIVTEDWRSDLHAYVGGVGKRLDCPPVAVGGTADHVHLLVRFSRTISVADLTKETKRASSGFAKSKASDFAWQAGYSAFSVDSSRLDEVAGYVRNQEEHHRRFSFQDEFRQILSEHGLEWDERYVWE